MSRPPSALPVAADTRRDTGCGRAWLAGWAIFCSASLILADRFGAFVAPLAPQSVHPAAEGALAALLLYPTLLAPPGAASPAEESGTRGRCGPVVSRLLHALLAGGLTAAAALWACALLGRTAPLPATTAARAVAVAFGTGVLGAGLATATRRWARPALTALLVGPPVALFLDSALRQARGLEAPPGLHLCALSPWAALDDALRSAPTGAWALGAALFALGGLLLAFGTGPLRRVSAVPLQSAPTA